MSKKSWYTITAKADKSADVHVYDYIGEWGVTARGFVSELKAVDATQINLHINSPGGSVVDGVAIQNALKQHPANVTTYIDGLAGSIASIIALAGDEIRIADNAYVMIHNPAAIVVGEASDMLKEAEVLNKMAEGLAGDYSRRMGITSEEARALMDEETWYLGQEAVDANYADSTYAGTQAAASFDKSRFTNKAPKAVLERFTKSPQSGKSHPSANLQKKGSDPMPDATTATEETTTVEAPEVTATDSVTEETATDPTAKADDKAIAQAVEKALTEDRQRVAQIRKYGSDFGFTEDADTFCASGKSVEDFRAHILSKSPDAWRASLSVRNPATQKTEDTTDSSGSEAVAKIKERRKAQFS